LRARAQYRQYRRSARCGALGAVGLLDGTCELDAVGDAELAEDVAQVRLQWERIVATVPPWDGPPVWHHGDLDVRNWFVRMDASAA